MRANSGLLLHIMKIYAKPGECSGTTGSSRQADDCGPSGDIAQKGINRENKPAAGFMIAKTFFLV
jgi:hypothetical protein